MSYVLDIFDVSTGTNSKGETYGDVSDYEFADFLRMSPSFLSDVELMIAHNPVRTESDPVLPMFDITDRGHRADPNCSRLRAFVEARGGKVKDIGIAMGTVIEGDAKLEDLGEEEKDDL